MVVVLDPPATRLQPSALRSDRVLGHLFSLCTLRVLAHHFPSIPNPHHDTQSHHTDSRPANGIVPSVNYILAVPDLRYTSLTFSSAGLLPH